MIFCKIKNTTPLQKTHHPPHRKGGEGDFVLQITICVCRYSHSMVAEGLGDIS